MKTKYFPPEYVPPKPLYMDDAETSILVENQENDYFFFDYRQKTWYKVTSLYGPEKPKLQTPNKWRYLQPELITDKIKNYER